MHDGDNIIDYHLQDGLLYRLDKLCVLKVDQLQLIRETHTSKVVRNFGVGNTISNLKRYVYWPKMQELVARFIRGCMPCCIRKPRNKKHGLYHPLTIRTLSWESISTDFLGGLLKTKKGHNYLFVV